MSVSSVVILLPLLVLCVVGLLVWVCWRSDGWLRRLTLSVVLLALGYFGYRAFYTTDSDLISEFNSKAGFALPQSARVLLRNVDGFPFWSDYSCDVLLEVNSKDFAFLVEQLSARKKSRAGHDLRIGDRLKGMFGANLELSDWECILLSGGDHFCWGLLKDGKTLFFTSIVT